MAYCSSCSKGYSGSNSAAGPSDYGKGQTYSAARSYGTKAEYSSIEGKLDGKQAHGREGARPYLSAKGYAMQLYAAMQKGYSQLKGKGESYAKSLTYAKSKSYAGNKSSSEGGIESLLHDSAIVGKDGEVILGDAGKSSEARKVKSMYKSFIESNVGKKLVEYMQKNGYSRPEIDGYGFLKLGKNVAAAVLKTNHPKYKTLLAVNKDIYDTLDSSLKEYVLAHETLHAGDPESGTSADKAHLEKKTDGNLKTFYKGLAEKVSGSMKNLYQSLANLGARREMDPQTA